MTKCTGVNCKHRTDCKRFLSGKESDSGWWFKGTPLDHSTGKCEEYRRVE